MPEMGKMHRPIFCRSDLPSYRGYDGVALQGRAAHATSGSANQTALAFNFTFNSRTHPSQDSLLD